MKKEVEFNEEKPAKLTYEQLENVCHQLSEQSRSLYQRLQEAEMTNVFKRLDYLFAVVENRETFPAEFTEKCIEEIVATITLPQEEEAPKTEE